MKKKTRFNGRLWKRKHTHVQKKKEPAKKKYVPFLSSVRIIHQKLFEKWKNTMK